MFPLHPTEVGWTGGKMITLSWSVERPKFRKLDVQVNQRDGFVFFLRDIKSIHPAIPSEHILVKIRNKKEADRFFKNMILAKKVAFAQGVFRDVLVNDKRMKLPYELHGNFLPGKSPKNGKIEMKFKLEPKDITLPGSASGFEFNLNEIESLMWRVQSYFKL